MQNRRKGFTLVELIVVLTILAILAALLIPALTGYIEKSLETSDIINVREAYRDVLSASIQGDTEDMKQTVQLCQKQDDWSTDPVTIAGVTHHKKDGNTENWKGIPVAGGTCTVSYKESVGIIFEWSGKGTADENGGSNNTHTPGNQINFNENFDKILKDTGILDELISKNNTNFEIDSKCRWSTMVPEVEKNMADNSLLKYGTWAYLGHPKQDNKRYLFWTSVDTDAVGAGKTVPIIVSGANGGFYISESTTAERKKGNQKYIAIADHLVDFKPYTKGQKYNTLEEAYTAYTKLFADGKYPDYKDTLPK